MTQDLPLLVDAGGGRVLEVRMAGPEDGHVLVIHHGTPGSALLYQPEVDAAAARGFRVVMYSRPGYGASTPHPGRRVVDAAADVATILDALGVDTFRTIGTSGGGPHALACAAALPGRCLAAAAVASLAPYVPDRFDWFAGMSEENAEESRLALQGEAAVAPHIQAFAAMVRSMKPEDLINGLGDGLCEADRARLTPEFAAYLLAGMQAGLQNGIAGAVEDDLAFATDWGFDLADAREVCIWHGDADRMVPYHHAVYLAEQIPGSRCCVAAGEGHSMGLGYLEQIIDELMPAEPGHVIAWPVRLHETITTGPS